jgi:two-component sensor histidine kinase
MPIAGRTIIISTTLLLAVGLIALLGIVSVSLWLGERSQSYVRDVIQIRDTRGAAVELRNSLQAAESSQRGFLATNNEIYLAPYDTAKVSARSELGKLQRHLAQYSDRTEMAKRLTTIVSEKIAEMDQTIGLKVALRDPEAMALLKTNRGKALMDEANVFLSAVTIAADEELTAGVNRQQENAALLRLTSLVGTALVVFVVACGTILVFRYAREITSARDRVRELNATLEERVKKRTIDLEDARDRAEVLLTEVNHRVANSLTLLASMVKLQSNTLNEQASKTALAETQGRILAISLIHKKLYTSGDVRFVALDEYLSGLVEHLETSLLAEGHSARLNYKFEALKMRTDRSVNLGVIAAEWITNAFKYAYPDRSGEIRIALRSCGDGRAELAVEDDGVGKPENSATPQGTGLGTRIVNAMAATMGGDVRYLRKDPGTIATIAFPL